MKHRLLHKLVKNSIKFATNYTIKNYSVLEACIKYRPPVHILIRGCRRINGLPVQGLKLLGLGWNFGFIKIGDSKFTMRSRKECLTVTKIPGGAHKWFSSRDAGFNILTREIDKTATVSIQRLRTGWGIQKGLRIHYLDGAARFQSEGCLDFNSEWVGSYMCTAELDPFCSKTSWIIAFRSALKSEALVHEVLAVCAWELLRGMG